MGACGSGSFSHDGSTPQISLAYSAIVLSELNFPDEAMLQIDILAQRDESWNEEIDTTK